MYNLRYKGNRMNIKELKELIKDLPDTILVEVNIVSEGLYYEDDVSAFVYDDDIYPARTLIITVGDSE